MTRQFLAEQFSEFAPFLDAVYKAGIDRDVIDRRLRSEAVALGSNEGAGTTGGFLVDEEIAETLWARVYATGSILRRCTKISVGKREIRIPGIADAGGSGSARFGGVSVVWTDEADPSTQTRPLVNLLRMHLKKLLATAYATDELLTDAGALAATIERLFGLAATFEIEKSIVAGTGIGAPLGVLNSPALITVPKESEQEAGTIVPKNLSNMVARLWGPAHTNAVWLMGNEAFSKLLELEEDGADYVETGPDGQRLLHQMPIALCEYTAPLGEAGDILLGDFSQYLIAEKESEFISSIHVKFIEDETAFKFRFRTDGQPAWASPITPENSTVTQSPFVALGARQ
ncbi:MAG: phage major capsid protein [Xanthobacteraceae bacterium]